MTDEELPAAFEAAAQATVDGHEHCQFFGALPGAAGRWDADRDRARARGLWIAAPDCTRNHGDNCDFCGSESSIIITGWADAVPLRRIFEVAFCEPCALRWLRLNPKWWPMTYRMAEQTQRQRELQVLAYVPLVIGGSFVDR